MSFEIRYSDGRKVGGFKVYADAVDSFLDQYPDGEVGHDGDLTEGGERSLCWSDVDSSIGDDGRRAIASIVEVRLSEVQRSILRIAEASGGADFAAAFLDLPFDAAPDVGSIDYRLAPLDVGFDLRAQGMAIDLGCEERLRVSYADERGERRVMSGPRAEVVARLEGLGFRVVGG